MARIAKGTHSAARHSLLDELTFNRDFDNSGSTTQKQKWTFHPSYSGFVTEKTRYPQSRCLPVNMMDTFLSDRATVPQVVPKDEWATRLRIKSNPTLRGFVADKVTNLAFQPTVHERQPMRTSSSKLVHDHEQALLVNITTPSAYRFTPNAPIFNPLGSVPPSTPNVYVRNARAPRLLPRCTAHADARSRSCLHPVPWPAHLLAALSLLRLARHPAARSRPTSPGAIATSCRTCERSFPEDGHECAEIMCRCAFARPCVVEDCTCPCASRHQRREGHAACVGSLAPGVRVARRSRMCARCGIWARRRGMVTCGHVRICATSRVRVRCVIASVRLPARAPWRVSVPRRACRRSVARRRADWALAWL